MPRSYGEGSVYRRKDSPIWYINWVDRQGRRHRESSGSINRHDADALVKKRLLGEEQSKDLTVEHLLDALFVDLEIRGIRSLYETRNHARPVYKALGHIKAGSLMTTQVQTYMR